MKLGATRQAIHDALTWAWRQKQEMGIVKWLTYLTKIESSFRTNDWQTADFLEIGWILAAINSQPPHTIGWLRWCYGADENQFDQQQIAVWLYMHNFLGLPKPDRYRALCRCAVDDSRLRMRRQGEKSLPIEAYAHEMGMDPSHWARDWHRKQRVLFEQIGAIDSDGVGRISIVIRQLRGYGEFDGLKDALKTCANP